MMMSFYLGLLIGIVVAGSVIFFLHMRTHSQLRGEHAGILAELKNEHANALEEATKAGIMRGSNGKFPNLAIKVEPYHVHEVDNGWFTKDVHMAIGYQHQLYYDGIPIMEPTIVVCEQKTESSVKEEAIQSVVSAGMQLADGYAKSQAKQLKSAGGGALTVICEKQ